jgi:cell division protein FtsB
MRPYVQGSLSLTAALSTALAISLSRQANSPVFSRLQTYIPTAALAILIFYFAFHALTGDRGLLLSHQREATLAEKVAELKRVRAERLDLEARARFLRDDSLSADLLEERAHVLLGFTDPRDYVIRTPKGHG